MKNIRFARWFFVLMTIFFCIAILFYNYYEKNQLNREMSRHAKVIRENVWSLNYPGVIDYLTLVAELENYSKIELKGIFDKTHMTIRGSEVSGPDKLLDQAGLFPKTTVVVNIEHNGQTIGLLVGSHRNTAVYTHFYIFLLFAFFYIAVVQYVKVLHVKMGLEDRVRERTEALSDLNLRLFRNIKILDQAQEIAHIGHFDYDIINRKVVWSDEVYRIAQQDPNRFEPTYENYFDHLHPEDRAYAQNEFNEAINQKKSFDFETRVLLGDGTIKYIQNIGQTERDDTGKPIRTIGMILDITAGKEAEEEKVEAQRHAAEQEKKAFIGTIAGRIAHDFNNILGVILGNAELALIDCEELGVKNKLEIIFEQTMRGKNLTRNLVVFAKDQEPRQAFLKISEKIDLVLTLMEQDLGGIEIIREYKPGVPDLLADSGMIEHALVNLIQNSIHAVSKKDNPHIIIRSFNLDDTVGFEIEDNGCGIPKEYHKSIYAPSFTLKGSKDPAGSYKNGIKGTGYGMSNVKKYIEIHKGTILVDSEPGVGTKFTISFPVVKKELTREEITEIRKDIVHFGKRVLLVEDEKDISDVQYRVLTNDPCNHTVDVANNGKIAIDLFDNHPYDFISLDYILMGEISGMEVYQHIRTKDKNIPILFISGNIEFLKSIKELKQGDTNIDHLSKPCQNKDYVNSINVLLNKYLAS